jgi:hypothetical protein
VNDLLTNGDNRLSQWLATGKSSRETMDELYWTALTRAPGQAELEIALKLLDSAKDRRAALEDLLWGLLNAKEFVLRK